AGPPPPPSESVSLCVDDPDAFDAAPVPASTQTRRFPYPSAATMVSFVLWQTKTSAGSFGGEIGLCPLLLLLRRPSPLLRLADLLSGLCRHLPASPALWWSRLGR